MSSPVGADLVAEFVAFDPAFEADRAEHEGFWKELLPYIFFSDVMRRLEVMYAAGEVDAVQRIFEFFEARYIAGSESRRDLIGAGFLESLPRTGEPNYEIRALLGPVLADLAALMP